MSSPSPQLASLVQHAPRAHASSASGTAAAQQQLLQQQQQPAQAQVQQLPSMSASSAEQQAAAAAAVALPSDDFVDEDLDGVEPASPALKPDGGWGSSEEGAEEDEATSAPAGESACSFKGQGQPCARRQAAGTGQHRQHGWVVVHSSFC